MTASERTDSDLPGDIDGFVRSWKGVAATVIDSHLTVVVSSPSAEALFPTLRPGVNLARQVFLGATPESDPDCGTDSSAQVVAALHASLASHHDDDGFQQIVGELSAQSREFSTAWAKNFEHLRAEGTAIFTHPSVGQLAISYQLLSLGGGNDDILIIWRAANPESESAFQQACSTNV
jgi:hypothetical protein